jgi:hypothetical protein
MANAKLVVCLKSGRLATAKLNTVNRVAAVQPNGPVSTDIAEVVEV